MAVLYGCPKKKPADAAGRPERGDHDGADAAGTPPRRRRCSSRRAAEVDDQTEDPLLSSDLQVVNDELRRRGFSPDVYFDYDESDLSDDTRDKLSRNADLLKGHAAVLGDHRGARRLARHQRVQPGPRRAPRQRGARLPRARWASPPSRLRTISYGEERPVCTESARAAGRRTAAPTW